MDGIARGEAGKRASLARPPPLARPVPPPARASTTTDTSCSARTVKYPRFLSGEWSNESGQTGSKHPHTPPFVDALEVLSLPPPTASNPLASRKGILPGATQTETPRAASQLHVKYPFLRGPAAPLSTPASPGGGGHIPLYPPTVAPVAPVISTLAVVPPLHLCFPRPLPPPPPYLLTPALSRWGYTNHVSHAPLPARRSGCPAGHRHPAAGSGQTRDK